MEKTETTTFVKNEYKDSHANTDWANLRQSLRDNLDVMVNNLYDNFKSVSTKRIKSDGQESLDPCMYTGSGGTIYACFKMLELLRAENG